MVFIEPLITAGARAALPFITSLVESTEELSANEILRRVSLAGLAVRRSEGLSLVRQLRGIAAKRNAVLSTGLNKTLNSAGIPTSITRILRNFSFTVRVTGHDTFTGEPVERHITVSTNDLLTKQQAIDTAAGFLSDQATYGAIDVAGLTVVGLVKSPTFTG